MPPKRRPLIERWLEKITVDESGCWIWNGAKVAGGYGIISLGGRCGGLNRSNFIRAHRFAYEVFNEPIPYRLDVLHTCDNPACVRPSHLWVGTARENALDMVKKGRNGKQVYVRGEQVGNSKLTWEQVRAIRRLARWGNTRKQLSIRFHVTKENIGEILRNQTWKESDDQSTPSTNPSSS